MKSPKIRLIDISVGYISEIVIKHLSLDIQQGEFTGIFGPNGAGKTTLLCAINKLSRIPEGKVLINNTEFTVFNENTLRRKIGYVPQHFDVDPKLPITSEEVILMGIYGKIGLLHFTGTKEKHLKRHHITLEQDFYRHSAGLRFPCFYQDILQAHPSSLYGHLPI